MTRIVEKVFQIFNNWLESKNIRWFNQGSIGRRFASGSFWSFIGVSVSHVFGLLTTVIIARILGQKGYGEFGIIISTLGMFSAVGSIGLGLTATRYIAKFRKTDPKAAGEIAGFTLILAGVSYGICSMALYVFSPEIATKTLNAPYLTNALRLISIALFISGIDGVQVGILVGFESFKDIARISVWRGLVNLPLATFATWHWGLIGAVCTMVIVSFFTLFVNNNAIRRVTIKERVPVRYSINKWQASLIWKFSFPTFFYGILSVPLTWIVNAILVNQPHGYLEMGLLTAAMQWRNVVNFVPTILSKMGVAIQSNLIGNQDHKNFHKFFTYNAVIQILGTLLMALLIIIFAPWIMAAFGKSFASGYTTLFYLCISWIFMSVSSILWDLMVSLGHTWQGFMFNFISGIILIFAAWQMINLGAKGVAIAYICYYAVSAVLLILYFICKAKSKGQKLSS